MGKSSIAVNLGISLAKGGSRVCVLDADTGLANANILLGLTPEFSLEHVLYGAKNIEDIMLDGPHGMKIIPGANGISECVDLHPRQQLRLTRELARIENDFDYLLIDTAAGIADTTLNFVSAAQHTLVVITPEPTSLTDAFSLIKLLHRRRSKTHYQVVVNMCGSSAQAKEVYHRFSSAVEKYIGVEATYLGHILRDESMRAAVLLQNPVAMFPDNDPSCRSFLKLADQVENATRGPVNRSFSAYWHRQYRQQRSAEGKKAANAPVPVVSEPPSAESRDNEYLSELRSRLLLLIEQGHADETAIEKMLKEGIEAFFKRYDHSPINVFWLVEQLVHLPERDDQLLREIADLVEPWGGHSHTPPINELAGVADDAGAKNEALEVFAEADPLTPAAAGPEPEPEPTLQTETEIQAMAVTAAVEQVKKVSDKVEGLKSNPIAQTYDGARFGSQHDLLDVLRKHDGGTPLSELLKSLA